MPTTGAVEYIGTAIGSTAFSPTYALSKSNDDDTTTFYASNATGNTIHIGQDMGVNVTPDAMLWIPRFDRTGTNFATLTSGANLRYSDDNITYIILTSTFIPLGTADYPTSSGSTFRGAWNRKAISGAGSHRYWDVINVKSGSFDFTELAWEGPVNLAMANYRPCRPRATPGSGRYAVGQSITFTSRTTSGTCYWLATSDGTEPGTPTNASNTGAFTPTSTSVQQKVKVVCYDASCPTNYSEVVEFYYNVPAQFAPLLTVQQGEYDWDSGIRSARIESHGGHYLDDTAHSGYYYRLGDKMNPDNVETGAYPPDGNFYYGTCLYRSTDLLNWESPNADGSPFYVLSTLPGLVAGEQHIERPTMIRNPNTAGDANKQYLIYSHVAVNYNDDDYCLISYAPTPASAFTNVATPFKPDGFGVKDCCAFVQSNNDVWFVYTNSAVGGDHVVAYKADSATGNCSFTATGGTIFAGTNQEAPQMFERNGYIFLMTGKGLLYGAQTQVAAQYQVATTVLGLSASTPTSVWQAPAPLIGTTLYFAQPSFVQKVAGQDVWIAGFDVWDVVDAGADMYNAGYVRERIVFDSDTAFHINQDTTWSFLATGVVSTSLVTATTLTVSTTAASGGTSPYNYQFQRAPDVAGSPGSFSNIGPNSSATSYGDTGLTANTTYWYRVVVTDTDGGVVNSSSVSVTTSAAPVAGGGNPTASLSYPTTRKVVRFSGGAGGIS